MRTTQVVTRAPYLRYNVQSSYVMTAFVKTYMDAGWNLTAIHFFTDRHTKQIVIMPWEKCSLGGYEDITFKRLILMLVRFLREQKGLFGSHCSKSTKFCLWVADTILFRFLPTAKMAAPWDRHIWRNPIWPPPD